MVKDNQPLNLKNLFGDRYKIELDEATHCRGESKKDPWYFQIPCKFGHIYPHSSNQLGYYCNGPRLMKRLQREHPEIEISQEGDFEAIFLFSPPQFDMIATYAHPKRKRRVTEAAKRQLVEAGYATRF